MVSTPLCAAILPSERQRSALAATPPQITSFVFVGEGEGTAASMLLLRLLLIPNAASEGVADVVAIDEEVAGGGCVGILPSFCRCAMALSSLCARCASTVRWNECARASWNNGRGCNLADGDDDADDREILATSALTAFLTAVLSPEKEKAQ